MSPAPKSCPIEQEEKILCAAANCILEASLMDFTMSAIAKRAEMSMGSVYKHIHSKEDVLLALAVKTQQNLKRCFAQIYAQPITGPEHLIGLSLIDFNSVDPYPFSRHLEMLISNHVILERASPIWRQRLEESAESLTQVCRSGINSAIAGEELIADESQEDTAHQLMLAIWSLNVGSIQVGLQTMDFDQTEASQLPYPKTIDDPHILNMMRLINSFHWRQPLTREGIERAASVLVELGYR
ncbi:MAG: TetR/AcrR family transcriptional regulator [Cellvibrionaceae bacterium]